MMSVLPTPRMAKAAALKPFWRFAEKFGTSSATSCNERGFKSAIDCALIDVTAIGVDCKLDSRRVAVTTISSRPPEDAPVSAGAVAVCA